MIEVWKEIEGFEGFYSVSNMGRVKSLDRISVDSFGVPYRYKGEIMSPGLSAGRYYQIRLSRERFKMAVMVHRLVAMAFVPNILNKPFVNHIDGNRLNNRFDNLEWCTSEENIQHAFRMGLIPRRKGSEHHGSKLNESKAEYIFNSSNSSRSLAKEFGVSQQVIMSIKHGRTWRHITSKNKNL